MNETIKLQLNHRSIRKFKQQKIAPEIINTLVDVAQHTSTSSFTQAYSILSITDETIKQQIATIGNQEYIATAGHLFVFLADQHRNAKIAQEAGQEISVLSSFDRFFVAATDALLAAQNVLLAAESLGLGGVFLGSILNDAHALIDILKLPEYVVPVLGLAIGYPDQQPQLKPRLPQKFMHFENTYPQDPASLTEQLAAYDETVQEYYDLRDANRRIDKFTTQITKGMQRKHPGRMKLLAAYQKQKFIGY